MVEIGVIVHHIEVIAQQCQRNLAAAVQTGHQRFHAELLLDEADLFDQSRLLQFMQKEPEYRVVVSRFRRRQIAFRAVLLKFFAVERGGGLAPVPVQRQRFLVDQVDAVERRFLRPGVPRVGVFVEHPFPGEALPVFHRGFAHRQQNLHLRLLFFDELRNVIARFEFPVGVEIGGDVDASLLHPEQ